MVTIKLSVIVLLIAICCVITSLVKDIIFYCKTRSWKEVSLRTQIPLKEEYKRKYYTAYQILRIINDLEQDQKISDEDKIIVIDNFIRGISRISEDALIVNLLMGKIRLPSDDEILRLHMSKQFKDVVVARKSINEKLRNYIELNLNKED